MLVGELKTALEDVWGSEMVLFATTVVETEHYTFVKTHRICDAKNEPQCKCKLWALGDYDLLT